MAEGRKSRKRKKNVYAKSKSTSGTPAPANASTAAAATSNASGTTVTETLEETLFWCNGGSDENSQNLTLLKLEVLGPFLFHRPLLCDEAIQLAKSKGLLPKDSSMWPIFFERSLWNKVHQICIVMSAVIGLCEKDQHVNECLFSSGALDSASLMGKLRIRSEDQLLKNVPDDNLQHICNVILIQGANYSQRTKEKPDLAVSFFRGLTDKVKLVDSVKDRGNANFKQLRLKAAIADYSTATKLCPFSPVLYCNRALCYLKNEDCWHACLDSYRALTLRPTWEKPYYRCAEAWHRMGEVAFAMAINKQGQALASTCADLSTQLYSFRTASVLKHSKSAESKASTGKTFKEKSSKEPVQSTTDKPAKSRPPSKPVESAEFEKLQCPELDPRISCTQLRQLCNSVKLEWCSPSSYFSPSHCISRWEESEPQWIQPAPPTTDPAADREPMMARFDEIWCPLLADVEESLSIIPPTFQYFSDGTVMHSAIY